MTSYDESTGVEHARGRLWQLLALLATLAACGVGVLLLVDVANPLPVAANFTRVGGETRVETAIEAARFWLAPPRRVYVTSATAPAELMLHAAECAMADDAPLLFRPTARGRRRAVRAAIHRWDDPGGAAGTPEVIRVHRPEDCVSTRNPSKLAGMHTVNGSERLVPDLRPVAAREKLASVVVFAAAKAPRDPPDVAVGMALAAHLATPDHEVSLVVVPRYLEAAPALERQLRGRREVVAGGVVLGRKPAIPEETRGVLRQVLRPFNRTGFLGEFRTTLGSLETFLAALAALAVAAVAARTASPLVSDTVRHAREISMNIGRRPEDGPRSQSPPPGPSGREREPPPDDDDGQAPLGPPVAPPVDLGASDEVELLRAAIRDLDLGEQWNRRLDSRFLRQVAWAQAHARRNRRRHQALRLTLLVAGLAVPALVALNLLTGEAANGVRWLTFGLSLVVALAAAFDQVFSFGEKWRQSRATAETLKREGWSLVQGTGRYKTLDKQDAARVLAERAEDLWPEPVLWADGGPGVKG